MDAATAGLIGAGIGALAGVITTIATLIFNFYTSKSAERSKRFEISFQKRTEAYSEVAECMMHTASLLDSINIFVDENKKTPNQKNLIAIEELMMKLVENREQFLEVYFRNRIFLSSQIDLAVQICNQRIYLPIFAIKDVTDVSTKVPRDYYSYVQVVASLMTESVGLHN